MFYWTLPKVQGCNSLAGNVCFSETFHLQIRLVMAENEKSSSDRPRNGAILYLEGAISWNIWGGKSLSRTYIGDFKKVWKNHSKYLKNTPNYGLPQWPFISACYLKLKWELQILLEWDHTPQRGIPWCGASSQRPYAGLDKVICESLSVHWQMPL